MRITTRYLSRGKILIIAIFAFILLIFLLKPLFHSFSDFLSKSNKINAEVLLVEGWLQPSALTMAYDEFHSGHYKKVITTGIEIPEYTFMQFNGYLVFQTREILKTESQNGIHTISVDVYSELGGEHKAHFGLYLNNKFISAFYADTRKQNYQVQYKGMLTGLDSVMIHFDNDSAGKFGDRNLYVKRITIDDHIEVPYQNNSVYYIWKLNGDIKVTNNFSSYAEQARLLLIGMGIDSSVITAVPGRRVKINRTLTSALAFREWTEKTGYNPGSINVVTLGTHARRSWMVYSHIFRNNTKVGIISLPDDDYSRRYRLLRIIHESLGILYYRILLFLFY